MTPSVHTRESGLTLVELVVVLAVMATLIGVAAPAFSSMLRDHRVTMFSNELHAAFMLTRSEAIRRGQRVTICVSTDGVQCSPSAHWDAGWIVFADTNGNAALDPGELVLRVFQPASQGLSAQGNNTLARYVSYVPMGTTRAVNGALQMGTIRVCGGSSQRALIINAAGRPRIERGDACS